MTTKSLKTQANKILKKAKEKGLEGNYFFVTTFERYQAQLRILEELEGEIGETGTTVSKEYVKGRKNIYINPAITEYNRTSTAANGTVITLIKIVGSFSDNGSKPSKLQELISSINGEDDPDE